MSSKSKQAIWNRKQVKCLIEAVEARELFMERLNSLPFFKTVSNSIHLPLPIVELEEKSQNDILTSLYLMRSEDKAPHKRQSTRIRGSFTCSKCNRNYIRKDSLQRHQTYECDKEPQFPCPFCPQKCKRRTHQIRHIKRQHPDQLGILKENNPELKTDLLGSEND
ncbi:longitudinals lacking protein, isoforms F/I/K/T-like [Sitophilus oryzae]|uniref:Longitudinals lacking protein, isoforms F/I/K/T-like n=1 Tax=Sitophilus oryzae TaxID=7048 RepID=A0A6J2YR45_SITOR|nr:longitudinals lacking protein, isoforms F/I/K/T-like [Sitophilus oryzae]